MLSSGLDSKHDASNQDSESDSLISHQMDDPVSCRSHLNKDNLVDHETQMAATCRQGTREHQDRRSNIRRHQNAHYLSSIHPLLLTERLGQIARKLSGQVIDLKYERHQAKPATCSSTIITSSTSSSTTTSSKIGPSNGCSYGCLIYLLIVSLLLLLLINYDSLDQSLRLKKLRQGSLDVAGLVGRLYPGQEQPDDLGEIDPNSAWLISGTKCHIPKIDAWDKSIEKYVHVKPRLDCLKILAANGSVLKAASYTKNNLLYFTDEAIAKGALVNSTCCLRKLTRVDSSDDEVAFESSCKPITQNALQVQDELVQVECSAALNNYKNPHSFIVSKPDEEATLRKLAETNLEPGQHYNFLFLGVDTVSRLNGYRQFSDSLSILRDKYKTLEFPGYNKVGENTFPNLIPLLTGLSPHQLVETQCWLAKDYSDEKESSDEYLDHCKYLWNFFEEVGYATYFSEDWPKASTFNYLKAGFKQAPTLFYGRPFTLARDKLLLPYETMGCAECQRDQSALEVDFDNLKSFLKLYQDRPHFAFHWVNCPQHDDLNGGSIIDHLVAKLLSELHENLSNNTFVIFFSDHGYRWNPYISTRIGHYESNLPLLTIAPPKNFIDKFPHLYHNLKSHRTSLLTPFDLFKTMISLRQLSMKLDSPKLLQTQVTTNQNLSSPLTIATNGTRAKTSTTTTTSTRRPILSLSDVAFVNGSDSDSETIMIQSTTPSPATYEQLAQIDGLSYKQKFPVLSLIDWHPVSQRDRSCAEAGIPDNYCVCHEFVPVNDTNRYDIVGASYYLVYERLLSLIKIKPDLCAPLELSEIRSAEAFEFTDMKTKSQRQRRQANPTDKAISTTPKLSSGYSLSNDTKASSQFPNWELNIQIMTKPGDGIFQEVVRYDSNDPEACQIAVEASRKIIEDPTSEPVAKQATVRLMNKQCKFSIHSDSLSRLSSYGKQSHCLATGNTGDNSELNKVCYCKDLLDTHTKHDA